MARIRNDSSRPLTIFLPAGPDNSPGRHIRLAKGEEATVDDDAWAAVAEKPVIKAWIADGDLAVGGKIGKKRKAPPVEPDDADAPVDVSPQISDFAKVAVAERLEAAGMTVESIATASVTTLTQFEGVGNATAAKLIADAHLALS